MVKALPGLSTAHLAGKKLQPSGIVYKRQRKLRTASGSLCEELLDRKPPSSLASGPQRKPDGKPELARLAHIKQSSNYAAPATSADQKPPKGAQQSPRIALGDVQQHTLDCQSDPQVHPQASATWGMTQEAQYFADLDTESLLEDEQDQSQTQPQDQDQPGHQQAAAGQDCLGHTTRNQNGVMLQSLPTNHPALQTPDAVALAKYHPNFQVSVAVT
ncbi:TPA: hypothetical protein ACH3X2_011518 [Trebouxia sp. C0005]